MAVAKIGPTVAADLDPATTSVAVGGYVYGSAPISFDADRPCAEDCYQSSGS
jgi:urease subunit beta